MQHLFTTDAVESLGRTYSRYTRAEARLSQAAIKGSTTLLYSPAPAVRTMRLGVMFLASVMLWVLYQAFVLDANAYAQNGGGGGGDVVQSALQKAIDWLSGLMVALGTLGFLISVCIKAVAGTNESRHHMAHMGMAGAAIAVVAGLLAPGIMQIVAGFAGGA